MCPSGPLDDLLARCPACGSILASDHLPSNPLVFAFWVVVNGRFELQFWGKVIGTVFVLLQNNVTFSVLPSPPLTLYNVETREKFWIHASKLVYGVGGGGGEEMGMRFLRFLVLDFAQTSALFVGRDVCRMRVNWPHSVSVSSIAPIEQWKTFTLPASYIIVSCRL